MAEPSGLQQMAAASALLHGALIAALVFMPGGWMGKPAEAPRTVMTISLGGGAPGPDAGGRTQIGGRAVQQETPVEPKRPEPVRPPAASVPEMTVPAPNARPARAPRAPVKEAPPDARGTTPTRGAETRPGSTVSDTGVRGQGFGLATGGGSGAGGSRLDVGDFCCPEYLTVMIQRLRANWNDKPGPTGTTVMKFTIQRGGELTDIAVEKSSGNLILDNTAQRALMLTRQLPPLPGPFPNPTLTVYLTFEYLR
jgi:TonB family protein